MKNVKLLLVLMALAFVIPACNNSGDKKADEKITDIPASTQSKDALASFQQGLTLFDQGDFQKARESFSKAIEQDPKFGLAYLMRSNTSNSPKEYADDVNAGKVNTDSASNWEKMYADFYATNLSGDRKKGIDILEKIAAAYPDAARAQSDLGGAYTGNNEIDKARTAYKKAIELNPKWAGGYGALANSYVFSDPLDLKKGEENALKVVELAPKSAGAEITLGDCYRAQNDFQKARDAYVKATQLDPSASESYYKAGHANTFLGNYDEARKNYADGGKHDVTLSASILNAAYSYLYEGNSKAATKFLMDAYAQPATDNSPAGKNKSDNDKLNYLTTAASIAFYFSDAAQLKQLLAMIQPLSETVNASVGTAEAKIFGKADILNWEALLAVTEGKFDEAKAKAEAEKTALDPIKDGRKLEAYHATMGLISLKEKKYADAVDHFGKADNTYVYHKYWKAVANEAAGNKEIAATLFKEVAAFNFNGIGTALVRNDAKKKIATP